jgi:hypothetical protein
LLSLDRADHLYGFARLRGTDVLADAVHRERCQDADDHHRDHQLYEGEASLSLLASTHGKSTKQLARHSFLTDASATNNAIFARDYGDSDAR